MEENYLDCNLDRKLDRAILSRVNTRSRSRSGSFLFRFQVDCDVTVTEQ